MTAELIITDNREVTVEEAHRLLAATGEDITPQEIKELVERMRSEQPLNSRSYFIHCEHGAYLVTRPPGSQLSDALAVARAVAGLHKAYGCHCGNEIAARYRRCSHPSGNL